MWLLCTVDWYAVTLYCFVCASYYKAASSVVAYFVQRTSTCKYTASQKTIPRWCTIIRLVLAIVTKCESKKSPPWVFLTFSPNGWEFLVEIYVPIISVLDYKFSFIYLQLWRNYAILSATTIISSKCPPSAETHAGWSHLIWHNFITVRDNNWIKICSLA